LKVDELFMKKTENLIKLLKKAHPNARIALYFGDVFQLLVAVILSAQCTDKRVNMVTPGLFARYPGVREFADADIEELEKMIYSTGFYRSKAKNIRGAAREILAKFGGEVPRRMGDLLTLPGVARKTANVVLSEGFGIQEGIVVDTHVMRLSLRLGFVPKAVGATKNAVRIEKELVKVVPKKDWGVFPHLLILHGREVCVARKPKCGECILNEVCPKVGV